MEGYRWVLWRPDTVTHQNCRALGPSTRSGIHLITTVTMDGGLPCRRPTRPR